MFNSITGTITGKFPKQLLLENNGIEWDFCMPDSNLEKIGNVGSEAKVYTWLQHTDVLMCLYGFASADERTIFLDLLKVDGVGPKGALKIMSSVSSGRLMEVLENGDMEMLEKIPGVGKKTAGKMMLTLKGKLKLTESTSTVVQIPANNSYGDLILSLTSMGYDKKLVEQKVAVLVDSLSKDKEFTEKSQNEREEILLRKIIVELA